MKNSVKWQVTRTGMLNIPEDHALMKDIIRDYCAKQEKLGKSLSVICDLYNKTFQLNAWGLVNYLENKLAKKHFQAILNS